MLAEIETEKTKGGREKRNRLSHCKVEEKARSHGTTSSDQDRRGTSKGISCHRGKSRVLTLSWRFIYPPSMFSSIFKLRSQRQKQQRTRTTSAKRVKPAPPPPPRGRLHRGDSDHHPFQLSRFSRGKRNYEEPDNILK
ncbi:hypothetical protein NL676_034537 [Syzygium grande]|nr:hypothetical protein NL676_034537 [Syzygium grande]